MTVKVNSHFINNDLGNAHLLKMVEAFQTWGLLQNQSEFVSMLNMLSYGNAVSSKIIEIPIDNADADSFVLSADTTIPASGSTFTLTVPNATPLFTEGQTLKIIDSAASNHSCMVRIASTGVVGASTVYSNVVVVWNTAAGTYAAASTQGQVLGSSMKYDQKAPVPSDRIPGKIQNVMQDFRESWAKGRREMSDTVIFDNSMPHLEQIAYRKFMKKFAAAILLSEQEVLPNAEDYGIMKGIPGFLQVNDPTATYKGTNLVTSGATFDYKGMLDFMARFTTGSKSKALVASPVTITRFLDIFRSLTTVTKNDFTVPNSPIVWNGLQAELAFGNVLIMPDRTLTGKQLYVNDGTNDIITNDYAMFVDLEHTKISNMNVAGEGAATVSVKDVTLSDNDTREMKEIETIATLVMDDPSTSGIIAFS